MKILICSFMIFMSVNVLCAGDFEGSLLSALMANRQVHAKPEKPVEKNGQILKHASVEGSMVALPSYTDQKENLKGAMEDAHAPDPVRDELHKQETMEDLKKYPVVSGQGPNEDESVSKAELDFKLQNPNPEAASALRMAEPAAAAA